MNWKTMPTRRQARRWSIFCSNFTIIILCARDFLHPIIFAFRLMHSGTWEALTLPFQEPAARIANYASGGPMPDFRPCTLRMRLYITLTTYRWRATSDSISPMDAELQSFTVAHWNRAMVQLPLSRLRFIGIYFDIPAKRRITEPLLGTALFALLRRRMAPAIFLHDGRRSAPAQKTAPLNKSGF